MWNCVTNKKFNATLSDLGCIIPRKLVCIPLRKEESHQAFFVWNVVFFKFQIALGIQEETRWIKFQNGELAVIYTQVNDNNIFV